MAFILSVVVGAWICYVKIQIAAERKRREEFAEAYNRMRATFEAGIQKQRELLDENATLRKTRDDARKDRDLAQFQLKSIFEIVKPQEQTSPSPGA